MNPPVAELTDEEIVSLYIRTGRITETHRIARCRRTRVVAAVTAAGLTIPRHHRRPPIERLMEKVSYDANGCWIWQGSVRPNGYGQFLYEGSPRQAHRVSYELHVGKIPDGLTIDHLCRTRLCVNPAHLEPVTLADNIRRGFASRRCNS